MLTIQFYIKINSVFHLIAILMLELNHIYGSFVTASLQLRCGFVSTRKHYEAASKPVRSYFEPMICLTTVSQQFVKLENVVE
jgi:hypothetical protein